MPLYTLHLPAGLPPQSDGANDKLVTLKDGFSWPAFLLPLPYLLWKRLWLWACAYFAAVCVLGFAAQSLGTSDDALMVSLILVSAFIGCESGALQAEKLRTRGYRQIASLVAGSREEAELKFFAARRI